MNFLHYMKIFEHDQMTIAASDISRAAACPQAATGTPAIHATHLKPCTAHESLQPLTCH